MPASSLMSATWASRARIGARSAERGMPVPWPTRGRFDACGPTSRRSGARGDRRLPPVRLDARRTRRCASGSPAAAGRAAWTSTPTAPATCGPGGATRTPTAPGVVIGSHLDSVPDGGAFDGPLGVVSALAAVDALRARGFQPGRPSASPASATRRAPGSASPAPARGCSPARWTPTGRGRCATTTAPRWPRPWPRPGSTRARRPRRRDAAPDRRVRRAARRAGPRAGGRRRRRSASAPRSGRTAAGASTSPARPTTPAPPGSPTARDPMLDLRRRRAGRPRRPPSGTARVATFGKVRSSPNGVNAIPSLGHRLAGRPRRRRGRRARDWSPTSPTRRAAGRTRSRWTPRTAVRRRRCRDRLVARGSAGCGDPAPVLATGAGHDAGILPRPACRRRCCSSATRPGSRTRPTSTPSRRTAWPASRRWPRGGRAAPHDHVLVRARLARRRPGRRRAAVHRGRPA